MLVRCWARGTAGGSALDQRPVFAGIVERPHCVSHIAEVQKRNKTSRLILNLRPVRVVNDSCCKVTFQHEYIKTVVQLIEPKDDLVTVDIKKHHIKIHGLYCPQEPFNNIIYKTIHLLAINLYGYAAGGETFPVFRLQKTVTLLVIF